MEDILKNDEIVYKKDSNGIEYIQFKRLLDYNIKHCYTLKGENIDFSENSPKRDENLRKIAEDLEINPSFLVRPLQNHTDNVKCIDYVMTSDKLQNIDGLITNKKDIALMSRNADCILMLFYDPIKKVIANVHSGWKGTFQKICEKAALKMINYYGCDSKDINCFICPSIRKCHFEVDEDVKELCEDIFYFLGTEKFIFKGEIKEGKQKYYIDNVLINKLLLKETGIKEENIIDSNICSVCNKEIIHSYRAEGKSAKRATAIIML